jgi:hypothetical protein
VHMHTHVSPNAAVVLRTVGVAIGLSLHSATFQRREGVAGCAVGWL